jgi:hypothetical protein
MRRVNRVEPAGTGDVAGDLTRATVTTTTRMEFVRRVEVVPMVCTKNTLDMNERIVCLHVNRYGLSILSY